MKRVFLILSLLLPITMLISNAASAESKLAATIFSYDGADFVRTQTTLTHYDANYAPLIGADGKLTGALFVGVSK
jgi:hypothetical protein